MTNQQFTEAYYKSIKQAIPSKERNAFKRDLDAFVKAQKDLPYNEFQDLLAGQFRNQVEVYQRLNINQELATMRIILTVFFVLTLVGLMITLFSLS